MRKRTISALVGATLAVLTMASLPVQAADPGKAVFDKYACASCHGADAKTSLDPTYPVLAGQHADYLQHALRAYRRGQDGAPASANVRVNPVMGVFAAQMSAQEMADVAAWLASLPSDLGVRR